MKPVYVCSECMFKFEINYEKHSTANLKHYPCKGTLQPYFAASDIENLIKGRIQELIMKAMYDGSMGVMLDPDSSVYNELNLILAALEVEEE